MDCPTPTAAAKWTTASASSIAFPSASRSRTSATASSTAGSRYSGRSPPSCTCGSRSSSARTSWPSARSRSARCEPMNPAPPVMRTRIPRTLSALPDPGLKPSLQRLDHRGGRERLDGAAVGGLAESPNAVAVRDEPAQRVGERLGVARLDEAGRIPQRLLLGDGVRGDDGTAGRGTLEDLVRDDTHPFRAGAEDPQADVVLEDERGELVALDPVEPLDRGRVAGEVLGPRELLAAPRHREAHLRRVRVEEPDRLADHGRALERRVDPEEDDANRAFFARLGLVEPLRRRPDVDREGLRADRLGQELAVPFGVDEDEVGRAHGRFVDPVED